MNYPKMESKSSFNEFGDSFFSAFELNKDDSLGSERTTSTSPLSMFTPDQDYVSNYLHCAYDREKPPMQKSLSWSSTDPSIAFERDSYLMPYACNDYKKYALSSERPRSITLPSKSSSTYLSVDEPSSLNHNHHRHSHHQENYSKYESLSSLSTNSDSLNTSGVSTKTVNLNAIKESPRFRHPIDIDECVYNSSQEEIDLIICDSDENTRQGDWYLRQVLPARQRSNTAPPNISITGEDGHSKYILNVLCEEECGKIRNCNETNKKTNNETNNNNNNNVAEKNNETQFNKTIKLINNYCS